jgi:hypothetical protein
MPDTYTICLEPFSDDAHQAVRFNALDSCVHIYGASCLHE